jgi:hypothetical protein
LRSEKIKKKNRREAMLFPVSLRIAAVIFPHLSSYFVGERLLAVFYLRLTSYRSSRLRRLGWVNEFRFFPPSWTMNDSTGDVYEGIRFQFVSTTESLRYRPQNVFSNNDNVDKPADNDLPPIPMKPDINPNAPLTLRNRITGFANRPEDQVMIDVKTLPEGQGPLSTTPINGFGLAMLKGMGYQPGSAIGIRGGPDVEPAQFRPRPIGLGAPSLADDPPPTLPSLM